MKATIWHNPKCGTSRKTLALLEEAGADVQVIEYLKTPPTRDKLAALYARAGITPRQGLRAKQEEAAPFLDAGDDKILDAMVARGDLDYIITAPVEKDQMVGPLQAAVDAGIKIITVDTFLGDGDYANGPVTFPLSYIGSDNVEGGRISARGLAKAIGGKGKVYINSTNPNVSSVQGREQGFAEVMKNEFPEITVLGPDYNLDDAAKDALRDMIALIQRRTNLDATEAYMLCSLAADVRVTQLVNEQKGCHVVLPKSALG